MSGWIDALIVGIALGNVMLLSSSRLANCVRLVALQGVAVGLLPLLANPTLFFNKILLLTVVIVAFKGFVFPWFLLRALKQVNIRREVEPLVGYTPSMLVSIASLLGAVWVTRRLPLPMEIFSDFAVPVSFATIFAGLFMIITRTKALNQVVGYLMLENGIYIFGIALLLEQPTLIELGILLDVFVAVFVMGIMIFHINQEFDHMDTDRLALLRDWQPSEEEVR